MSQLNFAEIFQWYIYMRPASVVPMFGRGSEASVLPFFSTGGLKLLCCQYFGRGPAAPVLQHGSEVHEKQAAEHTNLHWRHYAAGTMEASMIEWYCLAYSISRIASSAPACVTPVGRSLVVERGNELWRGLRVVEVGHSKLNCVTNGQKGHKFLKWSLV